MAKHRKRRDRDHTSISSLLAPVVPAPRVRISTAAEDLRRLQDRRRFDAEVSKPPVDATGARARVTMKPLRQSTVARRNAAPSRRPGRSFFGGIPHEVQSFDQSPRVAVCVRRKSRREVLFALQRTKAGKGSPKRRNQWSDVHCK